MGSFRSATERAYDQAVLTVADRPVGLPALDPKGRPNWLAEGETVTYWMRLPHGAARRIAAAATHAAVDSLGRVTGTYDIGAASLTKHAEGIVDWTLADSTGHPIRWDPRQAATLLDGLPGAVLTELGERIGAGEPPSVADEKDGPPEAEEAPEDDGEQLGNA